VAITVKKKSLKLKTGAPAAADTPEEQPAEEESQSVLATMGTPSSASAGKKGGSFVPYFIMGLIACAALGALVAMQFIENSFYTGMVP
jgi:hypothetical protein